MGFPILVRCHLYIESGPWTFTNLHFQWDNFFGWKYICVFYHLSTLKIAQVVGIVFLNGVNETRIPIYPGSRCPGGKWNKSISTNGTHLVLDIHSSLSAGKVEGNPDSKVHGANMGPIWVLSAPDGPHVGPMNLAIREIIIGLFLLKICWWYMSNWHQPII